MLRIAVCDDEPQIVKPLTDLVMQCAPDCELTCYAHGEELLEAQKTFDLIFFGYSNEAFEWDGNRKKNSQFG